MKDRLALAVVVLAIAGGLALWVVRAPHGSAGSAAPGGSAVHSAVPSDAGSAPGSRPSPGATARGGAHGDNPTGLPANWKLAFSADFAGSRLDTSVWSTCYPWMDEPSGCTNFGNTTEHEWYLPSQDKVSGNALHIVAQRVATAGTDSRGAPREYFCRSGMVTTHRSFNFTYGYVQVVARMPAGKDLWSALWLAPSDLRWPPELDMIEYWSSSNPPAGVFVHRVHRPRVIAYPATADLTVGWHTFSVMWSPANLAFFIDGKNVLSTIEGVPHQPMYLIANLANTGRADVNGACDGSMLIRSVRIWQP